MNDEQGFKCLFSSTVNVIMAPDFYGDDRLFRNKKFHGNPV